MANTKFSKSTLRLNEMTAEYLMDPAAAAFQATDGCDVVIVSMVKNHAGGAPIIDRGGSLVGIVTEFDLLEAILDGKDLSRTPTEEIMTKNPVSVSEKTPATEILDTLRAGHILHLPVVDADGRFLGMIERHHALAGYLETALVDRLLPEDYPEVG